MNYILDKNNEAQECDDIMEWGLWFSNFENRRVAEDIIDGIKVSTIFLGIDHAFGGGPPVLWETMVFGSNSEYQDRYTSHEDALVGHAKACDILRGKLP